MLETIKCSNGELFNLEFHQHRFNLARKQCFETIEPILLNEAIEIPENAKNGLFRCRVVYGEKIETLEFLPHQYRRVSSLKLIIDNEIDYPLKFANRKRLNQLFEQRGDCDDILIVKNGCITDSYTANTIFFDGTRWWTPDTPLLPGTQRARLISEKQLNVCRITLSDLQHYSKVGLINAMQNLEDMPLIDTNAIK